MSETCVFCRIIKGEIPAKKVYEDSNVIAIEDLKPAAPIHYLFIPKKHVKSINELNLHENSEEGAVIIQKLFAAINKVTRKFGVDEPQFKVAVNTGPKSGQTVFHLHIHVLAGKEFNNHFHG